jgi:hypothetical protein
MSEKNIAGVIRSFCRELETLSVGKPVAIHVTEKIARELQEEISPTLKYASLQNFRHNEMLLNGVLLVAPLNFVWNRK